MTLSHARKDGRGSVELYSMYNAAGLCGPGGEEGPW